MADDESKIFAFLAYLLGIIGFVIVLVAKKDDKFAMYHAKQSLVLTIFAFVGWIVLIIVGIILGFIPILGIVLDVLLLLAFWLSIMALWILGMVNALTMKQKPLPIIGQYAEKINL